MKNERLLRVLISLGLIAVAIVILTYYWGVDSWEAVKYVPVSVMTMCVVYILLQVLKRYLFKDRNWWDWLYYLGLASVMLPTVLASPDSEKLYGLITDIGPFFLIVPVLLDGRILLRQS